MPIENAFKSGFAFFKRVNDATYILENKFTGLLLMADETTGKTFPVHI